MMISAAAELFLRAPTQLRISERATAISRINGMPKYRKKKKKAAHTCSCSCSGGDWADTEADWTPDQLAAVSSLFRGSGVASPKKNTRDKPRYLPLPNPHKIRPLTLPLPKYNIKRNTNNTNLYKSPQFLVSLARELRDAPRESISHVLEKWERVLKKGSLSFTIRELGKMGLPHRAIHVFRWVQKQTPRLYPDERVVGSILDVLATSPDLSLTWDIDEILMGCPVSIYNKLAKSFIRSWQLDKARQVIMAAKSQSLDLDHEVHAKLFSKTSRSPKHHNLATELLEELASKDTLCLEIQDCNAVMKGCINLHMFEGVERMFSWWKASGGRPNVVMYTTVMHSRYCSGKYREGLGVVWEMEESNCLFDLPAYSVVIRICSQLNELSKAARYFAHMKEAGLSPTCDIYENLLCLYQLSGRVQKCKELLKEMEMQGMKPHSVACLDDGR